MRVQTIERMRRLFVMVLLAVLFVYHVGRTWSQHTILWLRQLGGKLSLSSDLDEPYICWLASVRSLALRLRWLLLVNRPSPEQEGLVGNHQSNA